MAKQETERKQAHGLTKNELADLQSDQISGDTSQITGSDGKTKINKAEASLYHVKLQVPGFNQVTGEATSRPFVQQYSEREFESMKANNGFQGYKVYILHTPKGATAHKEGEVETVVRDLTNAKVVRARFKQLYGYDPADTLNVVEMDAAIRLKEAEKKGETPSTAILSTPGAPVGEGEGATGPAAGVGTTGVVTDAGGAAITPAGQPAATGTTTAASGAVKAAGTTGAGSK